MSAQQITHDTTAEQSGKKNVLSLTKVPVNVTPTVARIDPTTHSVTLTLTNTYDDTIYVAVGIQTSPPQHGSSSMHPNALIATDSGASNAATDSLKADSMRTDSLNRWSLASWVGKLPKHIKLAPHQTVTQTIHITVPSEATPGEYAAHIVFRMAIQGSVSFGLSLNGVGVSDQNVKGGGASFMVLGDNAMSPAEAKLVYRHK